MSSSTPVRGNGKPVHKPWRSKPYPKFGQVGINYHEPIPAGWDIVKAIGGGALVKCDGRFVTDPDTGIPVAFGSYHSARLFIEAIEDEAAAQIAAGQPTRTAARLAESEAA